MKTTLDFFKKNNKNWSKTAITKALILFLFIICSENNIAQNSPSDCKPWIEYGINSKLFFRICENSENNTVFFEIKNETDKDVKLTYKINFNNGESATGTVIIDLDDKSPKIQCLNCTENKTDVIKSWKFEDIIFRESDGFDNDK